MRWVWKALRRWSSPGGDAEGTRELSRGQAVRLPSFGEGSSLRLQSGLVVVTREGDHRDHVLEAGSELHLPRRGRVVAWAVEVSRIEVRRRNVPLADWRTATVVRPPVPARRGDLAEARQAVSRERTGPRHQAWPPPRPGQPARPPAGGGGEPG
jgi:hypothetical protein